MSPRWRRIASVVVVGLVLGASTPAGAAARVRMRDSGDDNFFRPRRLVVQKGTRVRWVNAGARPHTTTSNTGLWDSGTVQPGESFGRRFRRTGTFRYHCEIHDGMTGKIVVV
ncbi:MAG TPA: cupredoxin domain-containing protein [Actinomycetota bacterium]|nr:cupredoxin domain-containing protein [Actinomycetota bacterium]